MSGKVEQFEKAISTHFGMTFVEAVKTYKSDADPRDILHFYRTNFPGRPFVAAGYLKIAHEGRILMVQSVTTNDFQGYVLIIKCKPATWPEF